MDRIFDYLKGNQLSERPYVECANMKNLVKIYDGNWESGTAKVPYEVLTQLMDAYNICIERPDLGFLFCWEAINNSYNELLIYDSNVERLTDSKGVKKMADVIYNNYSIYNSYLNVYIAKLPMKLCRFVSSYVLRGFVIEKNSFKQKYSSSSYWTLKSRFPDLYDAIENTYGQKYLAMTNPQISNPKIIWNVDKENNRKIIYSLATKIQELIVTGTTKMQSSDGTKTYLVSMTDEETLNFIIFQILYASRCNNFHGNVASRLNSINANQEMYDSYKYVFLLAHIVLAIMMRENGYIADGILTKLKENEKFLD